MEELRKFRNTFGLSQEKFARTIGVSFSLYKKIECGERDASKNFIYRFKKKYPQFDANLFFTNSRHEL